MAQDLAHRAHFHAYALGGEDRAPVEGAKKGTAEAAQMYSLGTLMKQNGHDFIDILKVRCNRSSTLYSAFHRGRRLTPSIDRSISRVGNSKLSLHFSKSFPPSLHYLSVSCSLKFMPGISTSQRSLSGGRSSKMRALGPSGPSPTLSTPTITAVAPHT